MASQVLKSDMQQLIQIGLNKRAQRSQSATQSLIVWAENNQRGSCCMHKGGKTVFFENIVHF